MRCEDEEYYVVKSQNNPPGLRILANELLGTRLAARLGLPAAGASVIEVRDELIAHTEDLVIQLGRGRAPERRLSASPPPRQARTEHPRRGVYAAGRSPASRLWVSLQRHMRLSASRVARPGSLASKGPRLHERAHTSTGGQYGVRRDHGSGTRARKPQAPIHRAAIRGAAHLDGAAQSH